ncbi:MAG: type IV pilin protein [Haliea sp.]|nr:MAG: type IV pilin protein [Haliea sp.]
MTHKAARGFTLIELMITVAIVAILASVAYPSYRSYILKSKRAEARTALADLMQQQERFMTQRNCYMAFTTASNGTATATADTPCGFTTSTAVPFKTFAGDNLASAPYLLAAEACPSGSGTMAIRDCIRVTATPRTADPEANILKLSSTGTRECTGSKPSVCWK